MFFHGTHEDLTDSIEAIGAGFAVFEHNAESTGFILVSCNIQYEDILGKSRKDSLGQSLLSLFPRYIGQPMFEAFQRCKAEQIAIETEVLVEYKGKEQFWRCIISPVIDSSHRKLRLIQTCVEITEKKTLEKNLSLTMKRFEAVVQSAYDGIITVDENQNIKLINEAAKQIFGYTDNEIVGGPLLRLLPQKYRKNHTEYVDGFKNSHVDSRPMQARSAVRGLRKDGSEFPVEITISKIKVEESIEMTAVIRDISEKNKLLDELLIASRQDSLTGLCNRRHFTELLNAEIIRFKRFKHGFSLLMVDIDHFKKINDTYGHETGDISLKALSDILTDVIRETDIVGRWGGEEFLILLPETDLKRAAEVAEKIVKSVEALKVEHLSNTISFTVSIGVQSYCDDAVEINEFIHSVDKCLYFAKKNGRNQVSTISSTSTTS